MRAANNPEELVRTFDRAIIAIPSKYLNPDDFSTSWCMWGLVENVRDELDKIPADSEIPLVIYMHGCAGMGISGRRDIEFLARNNYAVLAPDSFARKYKPKSCDPRTYTGGLHRGVLGFRLAEARYAHEVARNLPWVDKRNIFMMGFSHASNDPWFANPWNLGHCGSSMLFRRNAESVVVDVNFHHIQSLPEVQEKILQFLEVNRRP